jgi:N utilization substance protein A
MLNVGYLVPFMVLKALPDFDSYLVVLVEKGILAQLPKRHAMRKFRIGETGWASVFAIKGSRVTLSQKSTQYVRKITEFILAPFIQSGAIKVKRVAKISAGNFYKVAVQCDNGMSPKALVKASMPYLKKAIDYLNEKIILVKYSDDIQEYIANALTPAPIEEVRKVIYFKDMKEANVYVTKEYAGYFLGPKGQNVSTASKLTGCKIIIIPT